MGALNLTAGQWGLGSTAYDHCIGLDIVRPRNRIIHEVPLSTTLPTKELGGGPVAISFSTFVLGANFATVVAAIETKTERHFSFLLGATEVYYHVKAGQVSGWEYIGKVGADYRYQIDVEFVAHNLNLYKASDDSVLVGG
jgi:hypothetical protein